ncbi:MAG: ABC transporter permease [Candidatus Xenobia bacterium]
MTLARLVGRRLAFTVFLLLGVATMTFFISHVVPGDPVSLMMGERGTDAQIAQKKHELGLDRPLGVQYVSYLEGLAHLDLGRSVRTSRPVMDDLRQYFPATVELATAALLISIVIGIPLGVLSAIGHNKWSDHVSRIFSLLGVSTPVFWLGLLLLYFCYARWDVLPAGGRLGDFVSAPPTRTGLLVIDSLLAANAAALWDALRHLCLPALCLGYASTATIARIVRAQMLEVLAQDYVRTARALGLRRFVVLFKYALKNALIPTVTVIGLSYGGLLSGAVLTESIFSWPGIGRYAVGSMANLDFPALMGVTLLIAVTYSLVNLAVDLAYLVLDPRIRISS